MEKNSNERVIEEYNLQIGLYSELKNRLDNLVPLILKENDVVVHSIQTRVKTLSSLERKILQSEKFSHINRYKQLSDLTDIVGVRITTFFSDDVDHIAEIIKSAFIIDWDNSVDKRATLEADRFGYLSLHHIVSLPPDRCKLPEYSRFENVKFEIQTRSILQHAWAEIEHDLGYKSVSSVPNIIKRRFSRLAGLLELVDEEFANIRKELTSYENSVAEKIQSTPEKVEINKASLASYTDSSPKIKFLDERIATTAKGYVDTSKDDINKDDLYYNEELWQGELKRLEICGIDSILALDNAITKYKQMILDLAVKWTENMGEGRSFARGVSLLYLCYILIAEIKDTEKRAMFLKVSKFSGAEYEKFFNRLDSAYEFAKRNSLDKA